MIEKKLVDRYAHQSGVTQLVAEREVVLTYALKALLDGKALDLLAFKGGTCLRKIVFGSTGRFSEDLDFTLTGADDQDALAAIYEVFNQTYHGITFSLDEWYESDDGFGMNVAYAHAWNVAGRFHLQVSAREKPTFAVVPRAMRNQLYFEDLEFDLFEVPTLEPIEMTAEKVRAAFQRAKVRDLYDLHLLGPTAFDGEILRRLVVLKLWQVRDPFDPRAFFEKLRGTDYDWADLRRLLRPGTDVDAGEIVSAIEVRFRALAELTDLEREVIADAKSGWNEPLAERLRAEVRERFSAA